MLQPTCSPVPDPFIFSADFDVGNEDVNHEHEVIMVLVNHLVNDRTNMKVLDQLMDVLKRHFEHEESIMVNLLKRLNSVRDEYNAIIERKHEVTSLTSTFSVSCDAGEYEGAHDVMTPKTPPGTSLHESEYDPIYECDISTWAPTGEKVNKRVYIADHVLSEKRLRDHKLKHAVFLNDCVQLRKNLLYAVVHARIDIDGSPLWAVDDIYADGDIGDNEILFVKNWYCQHVKTEDIAIDHTLRLISRMEDAILAEKQLANAGRIRALSLSLASGVDIFGSMTSDGEDSFDSSGSGVSMLTRKWLCALRCLCDVGVIVLRPPRGKRRAFTIVLGSYSWTLFTDYNPWELVGVNVDQVLTESLYEPLNKWLLQLTVHEAPVLDIDEKLPTSIVRQMSFVNKAGKSKLALVAIIPVVVASSSIRSRTLHFAAFFFLPRATRSPAVQDICRRLMCQAIEKSIEINKLTCPLICKNPHLHATLGWLRSEWKRAPLYNDMFVLGIEQIALALLTCSCTQACLGFEGKLFPCKWLVEGMKDRVEKLKGQRHNELKCMPPIPVELSEGSQSAHHMVSQDTLGRVLADLQKGSPRMRSMASIMSTTSKVAPSSVQKGSESSKVSHETPTQTPVATPPRTDFARIVTSAFPNFETTYQKTMMESATGKKQPKLSPRGNRTKRRPRAPPATKPTGKKRGSLTPGSQRPAEQRQRRKTRRKSDATPMELVRRKKKD